jgi:hypothetical protein
LADLSAKAYGRLPRRYLSGPERHAETSRLFAASRPPRESRHQENCSDSTLGRYLSHHRRERAHCNFPFYQVARFATPDIMIGNVDLLKKASNVPQCGIAIENIFREARAPAGLYTEEVRGSDERS